MDDCALTRVGPERAAVCDAPRPLRVTHVSTADGRGGAAIAAMRLHRGLGAAGVASRMVVAQRFGDDRATDEYNPLAPAPRALGRLYFRLGRKLHRPSVDRAGAFFSPEWSLSGWRLPRALPPADVINLHWICDFLDYRCLPRLAARAPLVWTLHDMNPFTGGCHYTGDCERFVGRCGACPQLLTSRGERDMTRRIFERKRAILAEVGPDRLTVVCPSRWLAGEARRSALFRPFDVRTIPYGLDLTEYRPVDRAEARRRFGLPTAGPILLFLAESIEERRKGLDYLMRAVAGVRDIPHLLVITLGRGDGVNPDDPLFRHLGPMNDAAKLRAAYAAADVLACPSLQDNCPNTVLESMACGTPVVGFGSGGIAELVADGETGLLADTGSVAGLTACLRKLLGDGPLRTRMRAAARERIERHYGSSRQAGDYARLYESLLA